MKNKYNQYVILGYYQPKDYYFAHILEHILAVRIRRNYPDIKIVEATTGSGYIFISLETTQPLDIDNLISKNLALDTPKTKLLIKERDLVFTETQHKLRFHYREPLRLALESNNALTTEHTKILKNLAQLSSKQLLNQAKKTHNRMAWKIVTENTKISEIQKRPFVEKDAAIKIINTKDKLCIDQIAFVFFCEDAVEATILWGLHKYLDSQIPRYTHEIGAYSYQDSFFAMTNNRLISYFGTEVLEQYRNQFSRLIYNLYNNLTIDDDLVKIITNEIKERYKKIDFFDKTQSIVEWGKEPKKPKDHNHVIKLLKEKLKMVEVLIGQ